MRIVLSSLIILSILSCGKESPVVTDPVISFTLTVTSGVGGSVSSPGGSYTQGKSTSVTATPDPEYVFVNWSNGSTDNPLSITVNSNQTVTANFEKRKYPLTVSITGSGTVSEEIISAGKSTTEYTSGSTIQLTATPSQGWSFIGWSGSVSSTENPIDLTVNESKTISVTFIPVEEETVLGNYGFPSYSSINQTTGNYISNRESSGRFISRDEAEEKINIRNGPNEEFLLSDQAQALFDFDGDGDLDLFGWMVNISSATSIGYISGPGKWIWWSNYEDENSSPTYYDSPLWFAARYEMNDFNGDGVLDLLWENENHHEDGRGGFYTDHYPLVITYLSESGITESTIGPPTGAHDIATGDIDNDGDIDIIEAEWHYGDCNHVSVPSFYINDGSGNFTYSKSNLEESSLFLQNNSCTDMVFTYINLFDINGDDHLDIVSGYSNDQQIPDFLEDLYNSTNYNPNEIKVWYGNGSGNFSLNNGFSIPITSPIEVVGTNTAPVIQLGGNFLDLDLDGFPELITIESYNYSGWGIRVYRNIDGQELEDVTSTYITSPVQLHSGANGPFSPQQPGDVGISYDIQIIDIDNDGDYDIMPSYPSIEDVASTVNTAYFENNGGIFSLVKTLN
ncbi:hypothetical protein N8147_00005 [Flavobacteriaceae bacterium]|nr:hypothetical protein [Flavobacteriaceae bacterium]